MIAPPWPTARQTEVVEQAIARRLFWVATDWVVQVAPPLVVARMAGGVPGPPLSPTAKQLEVEGHAMPRSRLVVPETWDTQLAPAFAVLRIVPFWPTAQHVS